MKSLIVLAAIACISWSQSAISAAGYTAGRVAISRSHQANKVKLKRQNPDGWFSLLIPTFMRRVERHADVDGGFYSAHEMIIDYDYWTYENTPNFQRDTKGKYAKGRLLACARKSLKSRTSRSTVDGKRAIIQECPDAEGPSGFRHVYYVTFPSLKVDNGEEMKPGVFNLTIRYKEEQYRSLAKRIARSVQFGR